MPRTKKQTKIDPDHYKATEAKLESFEAFRLTYGNEAAEHACLFNAHKYMYRHGRKGARKEDAIIDLEKAIRYLQFAVEILEETNESG
jgi:ribosomal protein S2